MPNAAAQACRLPRAIDVRRTRAVSSPGMIVSNRATRANESSASVIVTLPIVAVPARRCRGRRMVRLARDRTRGRAAPDLRCLDDWSASRQVRTFFRRRASGNHPGRVLASGLRRHPPAAELKALDPAALAVVWRKRVSAQATGEVVQVVETHDGVQGYARHYPSDDEDEIRSGVATLGAIYLDPGAWRGGLGTALLDAVVSSMKEGGFSTATLWVLEDNERARAFYGARGWQADGAVVSLEGPRVGSVSCATGASSDPGGGGSRLVTLDLSSEVLRDLPIVGDRP
ncbi:GNAT family N-acetyltransferase [Oerskovia sp. M15]